MGTARAGAQLHGKMRPRRESAALAAHGQDDQADMTLFSVAGGGGLLSGGAASGYRAAELEAEEQTPYWATWSLVR